MCKWRYVFILSCDITWPHDQRDTGLCKLKSLNLFATELSFVLIGLMELEMTFLICRCGHMFWTRGLVSGIPLIKITTVQSLIVNSWKSRRSAVIAFYFVMWHSLTTRSKFNTLSQHPTKFGVHTPYESWNKTFFVSHVIHWSRVQKVKRWIVNLLNVDPLL